jgi:hypothetical protein
MVRTIEKQMVVVLYIIIAEIHSTRIQHSLVRQENKQKNKTLRKINKHSTNKLEPTPQKERGKAMI